MTNKQDFESQLQEFTDQEVNKPPSHHRSFIYLLIFGGAAVRHELRASGLHPGA
jgi:hypothetical protein